MLFSHLFLRIRSSIITKVLILILVGGILPMTILGLWSFWMSYRAMNLHITGTTNELLREKVDYSELRLQEIESLITNISGVEDIRNYLASESNNLSTYETLRLQAQIGYILSGYINLQGLESIDIFSANYRRYHVGNSLLRTNQDYHKFVDDIIDENVTSGKSIVWHGIKNDIDDPNTKVIIASKRLIQRDPITHIEKQIGIIVVQYSLSVFNHKFTQAQEGITYFVTDNYQHLIYSPYLPEIGKSLRSTHTLKYDVRRKSFSSVKYDGKDHLLLEFHSGFNDWTYYAFVDNEYQRKMSFKYSQGTLILLGLTLILSILIYGIYVRNLLVPVKKLTTAFKDISEDRYDLDQEFPGARYDEIGELIKWFNAFVANLKEKDRYLLEIKQEKEKAEQANKAKDVFLANVSHELRTPLNGIISVTELMKDTNLDTEQKSLLNTILNSGDILYSLINQILDYSKIAVKKFTLHPEGFDLKQLCTKLADLYAVQAQIKKIRFTYSCNISTDLCVYADEMALQKIIINLLGNSIKFTSEGEIQFIVESTVEQNDMINVSFTVADTGIGIPQDKQGLIFEAFEQVDNTLSKKTGGTGLGLSIASQFAKLMGSRIELSSPNPLLHYKDFPGSRFQISLRLPISSDAQTCHKEQENIAFTQIVANSKLRMKALIVEDNQINQTVLKSILNRLKIDSDIASDGYGALDILQSNSYDYILMDIQMPGMNGFEVATEIRKQNISTPIIAITGNALKEIEEEAYQSGMNDFVVKPIRVNNLEDALLRWLPSRIASEINPE